MQPVDPASQLSRLVRTELARRRGEAKPRSDSERSSAGPPSPAPDLQALLAPRLAAIAPDDPNRRSKALRAFLEATFLMELGTGLGNEASFAAMVTDVQAQMESDPRLSPAIDQLASFLLKRSRDGG